AVSRDVAHGDDIAEGTQNLLTRSEHIAFVGGCHARGLHKPVADVFHVDACALHTLQDADEGNGKKRDCNREKQAPPEGQRTARSFSAILVIRIRTAWSP